MYLTGFADEASPDLALQIRATRELGWKYIETRRIGEKNLASLSDAEFEEVERLLSDSGVSFNCYGSAVANWSHPITEDPESSYEEMRRALPRMKKLGIRMIRIMSFAVPQELRENSWSLEKEVVKRLRVIVRMAEEADILCLHENCMNWGGLSREHPLRLLERIPSPNFRLVFDTGNPVFNIDYSGKGPHVKMQSSWDFYRDVRDFIAYVHIKDGRCPEPGRQEFTFAGEGDGDVARILSDLIARGYDGGFSIEPHVATVFHDSDNRDDSALCLQRRYETYIRYGRAFESLLSSLLSASSAAPSAGGGVRASE